MGVVKGKSAAMPLISFDSNRAQLDIYEVHYVSELPLVAKWQAIKVELSKNIRFTTKTEIFFRLFNFDTLQFWIQWEFRDVIYLILKI